MSAEVRRTIISVDDPRMLSNVLETYRHMSGMDAVIFVCGHVIPLHSIRKGEKVNIDSTVFVGYKCSYCQGIKRLRKGQRLVTEQDLHFGFPGR